MNRMLWNPSEESTRAGYVDAAVARIDADSDQVVELFLEEAISLRRSGKGDGSVERIELAVALMDAWTIIESMGEFIGNESHALTRIYQMLKPMIADRAKLVREHAEHITRE